VPTDVRPGPDLRASARLTATALSDRSVSLIEVILHELSPMHSLASP
jgi:hypothetical protein